MSRWLLAAVCALLLGCRTAPPVEAPDSTAVDPPTDPTSGPDEAAVRARVVAAGAEAIRPKKNNPAANVALGRALFWDPELSGNRDTACASCHHTKYATTDGLSLGVGTRSVGKGLERAPAPGRNFLPCHSPSLFHRSGQEWRHLFWDGRVAQADDYSYPVPIPGQELTARDTLAALSHYPVVDPREMRGNPGDIDGAGSANELANIPPFELMSVWSAILVRLLAIEGYRTLFAAAYPDVAADSLTYTHVGDAISAYVEASFHPEQSPFDRFLRGEDGVMTEAALRGADLFYGTAGCGTCHSGQLMTDQDFHNLGLPHVMPRQEVKLCYLGRFNPTKDDADLYAHRTAPLREVVSTGPYFHNGSFVNLRDAVVHHLDPAKSLTAYDPNQLREDMRPLVKGDPVYRADTLSRLAPELAAPRTLADPQIDDLMAFLEALSDPAMANLEPLTPTSVPSGLPVPEG
jgi:cytochrome c peroxidase